MRGRGYTSLSFFPRDPVTRLLSAAHRLRKPPQILRAELLLHPGLPSPSRWPHSTEKLSTNDAGYSSTRVQPWCVEARLCIHCTGRNTKRQNWEEQKGMQQLSSRGDVSGVHACAPRGGVPYNDRGERSQFGQLYTRRWAHGKVGCPQPLGEDRSI